MATELKAAWHKVQTNVGEEINLASLDIDDKDPLHVKMLKNFSAALEENTALRKLDLSMNSLGDTGVAILAGGLKKNNGLRRLDLSGNDEIDDRGGEELASTLRTNRGLTSVNLSNSQLGDVAAKALASMFERNTTLRTLNLSHCLIHGAGAEFLVAGLEKNCTLQKLNLEANPGLPTEWQEKILQMLTPDARRQRRSRRASSTGQQVQEDVVTEPNSPVGSPKTHGSVGSSKSNSEEQGQAPWIPSAIRNELTEAYQRNEKRKLGIFEKTEERGISVEQLLNLRDIVQTVLHGPDIIDTVAPADDTAHGQPLRWESLSMYQVNNYVTKPMTAPYKCSWVEFIGKERQLPQWMISHAWSTPYSYTVAMVLMHAQSRSMDQWQASTYWCCTFANNQHDLAELDEQDIMVTPFAKVLTSCHCLGTLLLCDPEVTPLKRVWCVFETHITAKLQSGLLVHKGWHLLDVAVPVLVEGARKQQFKVTLLQDAGNGNFLERSDSPGTYFPLEVAHVGTEVDICNARASRDEDRNSILNYVANKTCSRQTPPTTHENYDQLNLFIHRTFASAELYRLACERPANLEGIARLLELRADPTRFVRNGNTAIHAAVGADPAANTDLTNSAELLEMLLNAGSDPNVVNSQLCTALDYASKLDEKAQAALCPVLRHFGAKPFDDVAPQIENDMNLLLRSIVGCGFESEGRAFGARTLADTDARLTWSGKHCIQVVATNLCLYPSASCVISVQEPYNGGMSISEFVKARARAEQRGDAIVRALRAAGCTSPIKVTTSRQDVFLSILFTFRDLDEGLPAYGLNKFPLGAVPVIINTMRNDMVGTGDFSQTSRGPLFFVSSIRSSASSPTGRQHVQKARLHRRVYQSTPPTLGTRRSGDDNFEFGSKVISSSCSGVCHKLADHGYLASTPCRSAESQSSAQ